MASCLIALFAAVALAAAESSPLSIPPSEYWEGNDGQWSTFHIQIGSPGQTVRLLPGTSSSAGAATWVVIPEGCTQANPNLTDCTEQRGAVFASNISTSWSTQGLSNGPSGALFELITVEESKLGLSGNAYYGFDTIALGIPGSGLPTVEHQVVAGFATNDFWLGSLGLSPSPFNFTTLNDPQLSLMGALRKLSLIPSSTWAYTVGAYYQDPPVFGSLTLGGYDSHRIGSGADNITVAFGADISRDLLVTLDSISYDTVGSSPLLANSISIFINSLIAEMWLPVSACQAFEQAFSLEWDSEAEMYLLDGDTHDALVAQNPTFSFSFSEPSSPLTVEITLPYAAFDLEASPPLVNSTARYFPLKRAQNETQYTLGRVFLQEAYIIADYDRREFQLMQANFPSTAEGSDIVPLYPPGHERDAEPDSPESAGQGENKESGLTGGTIAGIVVGIITAVLVVAGLAFWYFRHRRRTPEPIELPALLEAAEKRSGEDSHRRAPTAAEVTGFGLTEKDGQDIAEMDSKTHYFSEVEGKGVCTNVSELASPAEPIAELRDHETSFGRSEIDGIAVLPQELMGSQPELAELDSRSAERRRPSRLYASDEAKRRA